ncbi:MAG: hypothetical protein ABI583_00115 [Betaproteobacteria bacterium]
MFKYLECCKIADMARTRQSRYDAAFLATVGSVVGADNCELLYRLKAENGCD